MTRDRSGWHLRGLTSLFTLGGFLIMSITGLVLYVVPQGRIAYWVDWRLWGFTKEQWGDVHILSSVLFIIAGGFHVYFNWKPLWRYLYDRAARGLMLKKEIALATTVTVALVVSGIWRLPPLSYLLDLNALIKDAWIEAPDFEPPFGHAELLSLRTFCSKVGIPLDQAVAALEAGGIGGVKPQARLVDIARSNGASPRDLYRLIQPLERPPQQQAQRAWTPEQVEEQFAGTGIGSKTLRSLSAQIGVPPETLAARVAASGLDSDADRPLKQLADGGGTAPIEVLKAALVEGYRAKKSE